MATNTTPKQSPNAPPSTAAPSAPASATPAAATPSTGLLYTKGGGAKHAAAAPNGVVADLGEYIFASNPYKAGRPPANTWSNPSGPPGSVVLQPTALANAALDPPYFIDFQGTEMQQEPGEWHFKSQSPYIARAIKIPYQYYSPSDADSAIGTLMTDYLVIGFEGGYAYHNAK